MYSGNKVFIANTSIYDIRNVTVVVHSIT